MAMRQLSCGLLADIFLLARLSRLYMCGLHILCLLLPASAVLVHWVCTTQHIGKLLCGAKLLSAIAAVPHLLRWHTSYGRLLVVLYAPVLHENQLP